MNEQAYIADMEAGLEGDLENIFSRLIAGLPISKDDVVLLAWAAGIDLETVKRQEEIK